MKMSIVKQKIAMTLVELLAVIVILGIIIAIAVPTIGGLVERQRVKADEQTMNAVLEAARLYVTENPQITVFTMDDLLSSQAGFLSTNPFLGGVDTSIQFTNFGTHISIFSSEPWTFKSSGRVVPFPWPSSTATIAYQTGFENSTTKTAFALGTITADGQDWELNQALRGSLADDKKNDSWSIRGRLVNATTPGTATTLFNTSNVTMISFYYANYGSLHLGRLSLWISNDNGVTWHNIWVQPSAQSTLTQVVIPINYGTLTGISFGNNVRFQFRFGSSSTGVDSSRVNLDDVVIYQIS
jgi:type II secretory pathway pseudopilin PulG